MRSMAHSIDHITPVGDPAFGERTVNPTLELRLEDVAFCE